MMRMCGCVECADVRMCLMCLMFLMCVCCLNGVNGCYQGKSFFVFSFLHRFQIQNMTHTFVKQKSFFLCSNKQHVHSPWNGYFLLVINDFLLESARFAFLFLLFCVTLASY